MEFGNALISADSLSREPVTEITSPRTAVNGTIDGDETLTSASYLSVTQLMDILFAHRK